LIKTVPETMDKVHDLSDALPSQYSLTCNVEICQSPKSLAKPEAIRNEVNNILAHEDFHFGEKIKDFQNSVFLQENVSSIEICIPDSLSYGHNNVIDKSKCKMLLHVYQLHTEGASSEEIEDEELSAASHWLLPALEFDGIWENLIFDSDVKQQLLNYATVTLLFSESGVDSNVISWNRVILLHGPAGTGKTSLCKALAQKLTIRLSDKFRYGQLIEINSHSLFSKWFSESGKLVQKMFQRIQELIDDSEALVFVLIDEVESLTAARTSAMNGSEPSDAIRVVNALLTQIDQIKRYPNVIILTTSNITGAIDLAFVDRADIKQYIGPPSTEAIYTIYFSCIMELIKKKIIINSTGGSPLDLKTLKMMRFQDCSSTHNSLKLLDISKRSYGLSGRTLRKLPFLAMTYSGHFQLPTFPLFLEFLSKAVDKQLEDRMTLSSESQKQKNGDRSMLSSESEKQMNGDM